MNLHFPHSGQVIKARAETFVSLPWLMFHTHSSHSPELYHSGEKNRLQHGSCVSIQNLEVAVSSED